MNLVQLANDLEYVPKDQLAQMSQDPNASFPSYLVLSEIQRRTQNEKAYAAAQPQPTTTVAEEVVGEFMQPQGLQAGMPPESAPTDVFSSGEMGMPASAPMQQPMQQPMQMASGGLTGYAAGDKTSLQSTFQDPYTNANTTSSSANPYPIDEETENKVIEFVKENPWATGLNAAALVALVTPIPGGRIASGTLAGLSKAVQYGPKAFKGLKTLYNKGLSKLGAGQARKDIAGGKLLPEFSSGTRNLPTPPNFYQNLGRQRLSDMRLGQRALGAGTLATGIGYAYNEMDENNTQNNNQTELSQADKDYNKRRQDIALANQQAQLDQNALEQKKANRMFSPTDLIQLGGTVMGAKNISELGQGIAGVAGISSQRKIDEEAAGLQARYYEAQTKKIEAEIAAMPLQDAIDSLKQINLTLKGLNEVAGDATEEQIVQLEMQRQFLQQKISKEQGYDPSMIAGNNQNVIDSYFPNAT